MKNKLQKLFSSIEKEYKISIHGDGIEMMAVFSRKTQCKALELDAPEILRVIMPHELMPSFLSGFGKLLGKAALCVLIGKREIIHSIKSPEDKI